MIHGEFGVPLLPTIVATFQVGSKKTKAIAHSPRNNGEPTRRTRGNRRLQQRYQVSSSTHSVKPLQLFSSTGTRYSRLRPAITVPIITIITITTNARMISTCSNKINVAEPSSRSRKQANLGSKPRTPTANNGNTTRNASTI